jgi:serralysin
MSAVIPDPDVIGNLYVGTFEDDTFVGTAFNDTMFGAAGNDSLAGGAGNDSIEGQADNDTMDGGAGADQLLGGGGDDTYVVADADTLIENINDGYDRVQCALTAFTLPPNFEELQFTGGGAARGTGNALANRIVGNIGADTLTGGAGADTLEGGGGDDVYIVGAGDTLIEASGAGIDTVRSSLSWALAANLDKLLLTGEGPRTGTGNALANTITGNSGANLLRGLAGADTQRGLDGDDTLSGGLGKDTLTGGDGNDGFLFEVAPGLDSADTVTDFTSAADTIRLDDDLFTQFDAELASTLAPEAFYSWAGSTAHDADDRLIYNTTTGGLFYDPDGIGGVPATRFAVLLNHPTLASTDFVIVG